jgi:hypothetical protein
VTELEPMLAINAIVKYKGTILSENSHQYFTKFWVTADSAALADIPFAVSRDVHTLLQYTECSFRFLLAVFEEGNAKPFVQLANTHYSKRHVIRCTSKANLRVVSRDSCHIY